MAAIPGWAYVIVGILISAFSKFVESKMRSGSLVLFFIAGIIFIAIGVVKIMAGHFRKKNLSQMHHSRNGTDLKHHKAIAQHTQSRNHPLLHNQPHTQHQAHPDRGQHHVTALRNNQTPVHQSVIIACNQCGARHYSFANFCMNCGNKLK